MSTGKHWQSQLQLQQLGLCTSTPGANPNPTNRGLSVPLGLPLIQTEQLHFVLQTERAAVFCHPICT